MGACRRAVGWIGHGARGRPVADNIVYAGTYHGGLHRSTDGGASWTEIGYSASPGIPSTVIGALLIDPQDPNVLFAAAGNRKGIYRTSDGGASWSHLGASLPEYPGDPAGLRVRAVAVDSSRDRILVGTDRAAPLPDFYLEGAGLYHTDDDGATWTLSAEVRNVIVYDLLVTTSRLFVATQTGLVVSDDGGATWMPRDQGLPRAADIVNASSDLAQNGLYGEDPAPVCDLAPVPGDPSHLFLLTGVKHPGGAVSFGRIYESTDGGESWMDVWAGYPAQGTGVSALAVSPGANPTLDAGLSCGVLYRSHDWGATWELAANNPYDHRLPSEIPSEEVLAFVGPILFHPYSPDVIWFAVGGEVQGEGAGSLLKTTDGGGTWHEQLAAMVAQGVVGFARSPAADETVLMTTGNAIWTSTDGGLGWQRLALWGEGMGVYAGLETIAPDPLDARRLFVGTVVRGAVRSTDGGTTWAHIGPPASGRLPVLSIAVNPVDPEIVFLGTGGRYSSGVAQLALGDGTRLGVYRSSDSGDSWELLAGVAEGRPAYRVAIDPRNPQVVYAAAMGVGVFKSTDSGDTWTAAGAGMEQKELYVLALDPADSRTLYTATNRFYADQGNPDVTNYLYRSRDGGDSWQVVPAEPLSSGFEAIAFDELRPGQLYLAEHRYGVIAIDPHGSSVWLRNGLVEDPVVDHSYTFDLSYDRARDRLLAGSCGRGVHFLALNTVDFGAVPLWRPAVTPLLAVAAGVGLAALAAWKRHLFERSSGIGAR
ncbi:MAG: hypothetical protein HYV63_31185 [Candidatus Schekmanbacteria bacterium]|nr:hypothetical protein [Candidatus Schekmanbacteria bacterium]